MSWLMPRDAGDWQVAMEKPRDTVLPRPNSIDGRISGRACQVVSSMVQVPHGTPLMLTSTTCADSLGGARNADSSMVSSTSLPCRGSSANARLAVRALVQEPCGSGTAKPTRSTPGVPWLVRSITAGTDSASRCGGACCVSMTGLALPDSVTCSGLVA